MTVDEFIIEYRGWILNLIDQRSATWPASARAERWDDMLQAAYLGVVEAFASADYDPEQGEPTTFVFRYVERELQRVDKELWPAVTVPWNVVDGRTPVPELGMVNASAAEHALPHDGGITAAIEATSAEREISEIMARVPQHLRRTMQAVLDSGGSVEGAATLLGVDRATVYRHLAQIRATETE